jgi:hypothetical protein
MASLLQQSETNPIFPIIPLEFFKKLTYTGIILNNISQSCSNKVYLNLIGRVFIAVILILI